MSCSSVRSPTRNRTLAASTPASLANRRACAIASGRRSIPSAVHPRRARNTVFRPEPQAKSIAVPRSGSIARASMRNGAGLQSGVEAGPDTLATTSRLTAPSNQKLCSYPRSARNCAPARAVGPRAATSRIGVRRGGRRKRLLGRRRWGKFPDPGRCPWRKLRAERRSMIRSPARKRKSVSSATSIRRGDCMFVP